MSRTPKQDAHDVKSARRQAIMLLLAAKGPLSAADIAAQLGYTDYQVKTTLTYLQKVGYIKNKPLYLLAKEHAKPKKAPAKAVEPGVIFQPVELRIEPFKQYPSPSGEFAIAGPQTIRSDTTEAMTESLPWHQPPSNVDRRVF